MRLDCDSDQLSAGLLGEVGTDLERSPRPDGDDLLTGVRLLFGSAMAASLVLAFAAIRQREVARHRAWMLRGYAIGLGAGTQTLLFIPSIIILGPPDKFTEALIHSLGWLINLAVAEAVIGRPGHGAPRRASTQAQPQGRHHRR